MLHGGLSAQTAGDRVHLGDRGSAGVCIPRGPSTCGNGVVEDGEQCDEAAANGQGGLVLHGGLSAQTAGDRVHRGDVYAARVSYIREARPPWVTASEDGEQCDDGNTTGGDCCSATCGIEGASQVCRHSTNPCVKDDHCDGNAPTCNVGGFEPPGVTVCAVPNSCTLEDYCDGAGTCVPGERVCSATIQALKGEPPASRWRASRRRWPPAPSASGIVVARRWWPPGTGV